MMCSGFCITYSCTKRTHFKYVIIIRLQINIFLSPNQSSFFFIEFRIFYTLKTSISHRSLTLQITFSKARYIASTIYIGPLSPFFSNICTRVLLPTMPPASYRSDGGTLPYAHVYTLMTHRLSLSLSLLSLYPYPRFTTRDWVK